MAKTFHFALSNDWRALKVWTGTPIDDILYAVRAEFHLHALASLRFADALGACVALSSACPDGTSFNIRPAAEQAALNARPGTFERKILSLSRTCRLQTDVGPKHRLVTSKWKGWRTRRRHVQRRGCLLHRPISVGKGTRGFPEFNMYICILYIFRSCRPKTRTKTSAALTRSFHTNMHIQPQPA